MAKLNVDFFESLINDAKESTKKAVASSPFLTKSKSKVCEQAEKLASYKPGLIFDVSDDDTIPMNLRGRKKTDISLEIDPQNSENNITVVVNWLVKFVKTIMTKVNEHAELLKFTQKYVDGKADKEVFEALKVRCDALEKENDEVRQRSLKGNLIISSPSTHNKQSLLKPCTIRDPQSHAERLEDQTELCCRLILLKTGVKVP